LADFSHQTVLLQEMVDILRPGEGKVIIDGTLGGGGHSEALLARGATVIGVDRDPRALQAARERLAGSERFSVRQGNFGELPTLCADVLPVDGVLVDLGVSSPQLDVAERGFSFQKEGPLDMRMGDEGRTAAGLIAEEDEAELVRILREYGEEPFARPIARELKRALPTRTLEAAEVVKRAVPRKAWPTKIHVATRTFQALRMAVNGELDQLARFLEVFPALLAPGGRCVIISFHSLEDRLVKRSFRDLAWTSSLPPHLARQAGERVEPICTPLTRKPVFAGEDEVSRNPRARSARLRACEKVAA
jgi:16S rRNA (cytosine1402-N4)-methyltransferase